jgi:hypothetical protein
MALEIYPMGRTVLCDLCGGDYTDSDKKGGFQLLSKAVCPECAPRIEKSVKEYNEEHHIRGRCPEDMAFADWVRDVLREGKPTAIEIWKPDPNPNRN